MSILDEVKKHKLYLVFFFLRLALRKKRIINLRIVKMSLRSYSWVKRKMFATLSTVIMLMLFYLTYDGVRWCSCLHILHIFIPACDFSQFFSCKAHTTCVWLFLFCYYLSSYARFFWFFSFISLSLASQSHFDIYTHSLHASFSSTFFLCLHAMRYNSDFMHIV